MRLLEARKASIVGSAASNAVALAKQQRETDALRSALRQQRLAIAAAHSAVTQYSALTYRLNPIERYIELGAMWRDRVATLRALRPLALRDGERYMLGRMKSFAANPVCAFSSSESFTVPSGDACFAAFDMMPLEGIASVKQAFDALHNVLYNVEIMWTEHSRDLMVREGGYGFQSAANESIGPDEAADTDAMLHHFTIATPSGEIVESKSAMFSEYSPERDLGVVCTNFVDHDALSPYAPRTRFRQDVSSAIVLRSYPVKRYHKEETSSSSSSSSDSDPDSADKVVVMARYYFVRYPNASAKRSLALPRSPAAQASSVYDSEDPTFGFTDCFRIMTNAIYSIVDVQERQKQVAKSP